MASKPIQIVGAFLVALAKPISAQTADSPADAKQLQEENRRLQEANAALIKSNQEFRKMNEALETQSPTPQPQQMQNIAPPPSAEPVAEEIPADAGLPSATAASWLTFDGETKPWSVNVGTRVWVNEWETNLLSPAIYRTTDSTVVRTTNSDFQIQSRSFEPTPIPYASARYGRFMLSGSYYAETDFSFIPFKNRFISTPGNPNDPTLTNDIQFTVTNQRSEWDVSVGYLLMKHLALTVGYKNVTLNFKNSGRTNYLLGDSLDTYSLLTSSANGSIYGPTLGLSGSVPIAGHFGVYGSYAHGFMESSLTTQITTQDFLPDGTPDGPVSAEPQSKLRARDTDYDVAELGIIYTPDMSFLGNIMSLNTASIFAGYRYQRISYGMPSYDLGGGLKSFPVKQASDTTSGFVAGVNFAF